MKAQYKAIEIECYQWLGNLESFKLWVSSLGLYSGIKYAVTMGANAHLEFKFYSNQFILTKEDWLVYQDGEFKKYNAKNFEAKFALC